MRLFSLFLFLTFLFISSAVEAAPMPPSFGPRHAPARVVTRDEAARACADQLVQIVHESVSSVDIYCDEHLAERIFRRVSCRSDVEPVLRRHTEQLLRHYRAQGELDGVVCR
jgi:hypothetical protein